MSHVQFLVILSARLSIFFPYYLTKDAIFFKKQKTVTEHKMCVLIFSTNFVETFLILRRTERDLNKMFGGLRVKYRLFLSDFNETRIFSIDFRKIFKY